MTKRNIYLQFHLSPVATITLVIFVSAVIGVVVLHERGIFGTPVWQVGLTKQYIAAAQNSSSGKISKSQTSSILRALRLPPHLIIDSLNAVYLGGQDRELMVELVVPASEQSVVQSGWMSHMTKHRPDFIGQLPRTLHVGQWPNFSKISQADGFFRSSGMKNEFGGMRRRHGKKIIYVIHVWESYALFPPKLVAMFKKDGHMMMKPVDEIAAQDVSGGWRVHYP